MPGLVAELFQHKAALRSVPAEIDTLIRDNRALSAEVVQLRKLAASERENASVLGNRLSHLQVLHSPYFHISWVMLGLSCWKLHRHNAYIDWTSRPSMTRPACEICWRCDVMGIHLLGLAPVVHRNSCAH